MEGEKCVLSMDCCGLLTCPVGGVGSEGRGCCC